MTDKETKAPHLELDAHTENTIELDALCMSAMELVAIEATFRALWPQVMKTKPKDIKHLSCTWPAPSILGEAVPDVDIVPRIGIDLEDMKLLITLISKVDVTITNQKGTLPFNLWISYHTIPVIMIQGGKNSVLFPKGYMAKLQVMAGTDPQAAFDDVERALSPSSTTYLFNGGKPFQITHTKTKIRRRVKVGVRLDYAGAPVIDMDKGGAVNYPVIGSLIIEGIKPDVWTDAALKRIQKTILEGIEKTKKTNLQGIKKFRKKSIEAYASTIAKGPTGLQQPLSTYAVSRQVLQADVQVKADLNVMLKYPDKWKDKWKFEGTPGYIETRKKGRGLSSIARKATLGASRMTTYEDDAREAVLKLFSSTNGKGDPDLSPVETIVYDNVSFALPRIKITGAEYVKACGGTGQTGKGRGLRLEALLSFNKKTGYVVLTDKKPGSNRARRLIIPCNYFTVTSLEDEELEGEELEGEELEGTQDYTEYTITAGFMMVYQLENWFHIFPTGWTQELMEAEKKVTKKRPRKNTARRLVRYVALAYGLEATAARGNVGAEWTIKRRWQNVAEAIGITDNDIYTNRNRGRDQLTKMYKVLKEAGWIIGFTASDSAPAGVDTITINCKKMTPQRELV